MVERVGPASVWDLGANTGYFSRIAAESGASTIAFDMDPACVERAYLDAKQRGESRLLPLVLDLFNPTPATGWMNRERAAILDRGAPDLVLALALIHHLSFVGNQPMENLAKFFCGLAPWLLIEFVPEDDPQVRRLARQRAGIHHEYNQEAFERCFGKSFLTIAVEPVTERGRTLYLLRRRAD
jgi:ribosomal protein L11 methylase PrmA